MTKITVLYGHPTDATAFETYYAETHLPLAATMTGVAKMEFTRFLPNPDGSAPAYYRMAELYFEGPEQMKEVLASEEGKATAADLANFAIGGVTLVFGTTG